MANQTQTEYFVRTSMKKKFGIELTKEQTEMIDEIYIEQKRNQIFKRAIYRFMNASFSIFSIILFLIFKQFHVGFANWFFFAVFVLFFIYNLIHCFKNYVDFKSIKAKEKFDIGNELE
ncbi:hypothetical protein HWC99_gp27 [Flavobacterium phage vB_FspS_tant8-1]|uniref:2TM domain-containing protein n=1 Tax=Flavobacterium phage vB_FspS_tant8-1 TaxID=2686278 RepID=A0A6B9LP77_9CAUD|nr:hypothetical protein HWC99_gp27 [Flavobacterium phage vB_FspS_tant8-1]QHB40958.1 hypothetical protein tant81_gp027 [Flavobacterium phage vB_FspS_tant8-1]